MKCKICERLKRLRGVDIILIVLICVGMYIANHFQMQSYYKERAKKHEQQQIKEKQELERFESLQRQCFFERNKQACEALKKF